MASLLHAPCVTGEKEIYIYSGSGSLAVLLFNNDKQHTSLLLLLLPRLQ